MKPINHFKDSNGHTIILSSESDVGLSDINSRWFDIIYWQKKYCVSGQSKGRKIAWFINPPDSNMKQWVLRHYYRGGMISKLTADKFIYNGISNTRCFKEIKLLMELVKLGLAVPKPIAARVIKDGFFYRADLIMEKLDAVDLIARLEKVALSTTEWQMVGETIASFHNNGVYHADLQLRNILIDENDKVWLIDFDRCKKRKVEAGWQKNNIDRLKRSFLYEKGLNNALYYDDNSWHSLCKGYKKQLNSSLNVE